MVEDASEGAPVGNVHHLRAYHLRLLKDFTVRVHLLHVYVRRQVAVLGAVDHPQEGAHAAALHLVAQGALDGLDHQRVIVLLAAVRAPERTRLHGVTKEAAIPVSLDAVDVEGRDARVPDCLHHGLLHAGAVGRLHGGHSAVLVLDHACNDPKELVLLVLDDLAVDHLRGALEAYAGTSVAADVPVCRRVEAQTSPRVGKPALHAVVLPPHGRNHEVNAYRNRAIVGNCKALLLHGLRRNLQSGQARCSFRGNRDGRTLHAEAEGEAPREHTETAHDTSHAAPCGVEEPLVGAAADVCAHRGVHEVLLRVPHHPQRVVALLHEAPLVGVQAAGLVGREVEELVVEELDALREAAVPAVGLSVLPAFRVGIVVFIVVPSNLGNLRGVVHSSCCALEPFIYVVAAGLVNTHATNAADLSLPVGVVHGPAPALGNGRVPSGVALVLHDLQLLQPVEGPVLNGLGSRDQEVPTLRGSLLEHVCHEEGADGDPLAVRHEAVGHRVGAEHDRGARQRLDRERLRKLRAVGLHLQGAAFGAQEDDGHEPVPDEL
mmetsp:Transcript_90759/g.265665  ORF Transcript_90759/g.265665 Transcript_90759/m.265665 type:complete len:547 (-) Transcript_90759:572-2212(-)